ncbi:vomeronasal type-1 receptor 45-like [Pongo pygmaeus]|uniref:vomeronasal type-1 receptor 45-like n=1 Tax=Pongo pygmaeus TaxID=9600 RepID=UPI0023E32844|nr:vomeronasal type-1 receptor 45-like [Pongo pygmaeus]
MLLIVVFLASPDLFESLYFQSDFKCKTFFYMHRVMRSLSICTTCLLSMLQAVAISLGTSWSATIKQKFTGYIFHSFFFLWVLSLSLSSNLLSSIVASSNGTKTDVLSISKYNSLSSISYIIRSLSFMLPLLMNVFFVAIILLSSAYMVILLSRHQRRSQYLHRTNLSPKSSPEKMATQTILLLVSCFVVMYWVDLIISSSSALLLAYDSVIVSVQRLVGSFYSTVSPFTLISSDKRIIKILHNVRYKYKFFIN